MTELSLNSLKTKSRKKSVRLGRGDSSGSGSYSGRGLKGQKARSGGKGGLKRRGLRQTLKSKPKIGGFKSLKPKLETVTLDILEKTFETGAKIDAKKLLAHNLIKTKKNGVKIIGNGKLTKKLDISVEVFSVGAKEAIVAAGGSATSTLKVVKKGKLVSKKPKTSNQ